MHYYARQGELNILKLEGEEIPKGLKELQPEKGQHILAHSETGHHHVIDGNTARVFEVDEFSGYVDVPKKAEVIHLRSFDTHAPVSLDAGKYLITRQREYTPEGFRRAID